MDIFLYGCSGHGKVILDILLSQGLEITAFVDDNPPENIKAIYGVPIYNSAEIMSNISSDRSRWIVSIGNNQLRHKIAQKLSCGGYEFISAIHPSAQIGQGVKIQPGAVVMANTVINIDSHIGHHSIVNTGATIDHDCVIGDFAHVAPGSSLCGQVAVGQGAMLGVGSKVIPCTEIGEWAICGAGSVIVQSIPSHSLAYGCPAKVVKNL